MDYCRVRAILWLLTAASLSAAHAEDYVLLNNGRLIECAILRQDSIAVYTTDWRSRHEWMPPLEVFTRNEIESIWFGRRPERKMPVTAYTPQVSSVEFGGSFAFQTWATTSRDRRHLIQLSARAGTPLIREIAIELEADVTLPIGGSNDPSWRDYNYGHQVLVNAVIQPVVWQGIVPFGILGGGIARDIPVGGVVLSTSGSQASTLDFGAGIKWGRGHLGVRAEWRSYLYTWTAPDDPYGFPPGREGDATQLKMGVFGYF